LKAVNRNGMNEQTAELSVADQDRSRRLPPPKEPLLREDSWSSAGLVPLFLT
jgi:hypothetical protein